MDPVSWPPLRLLISHPAGVALRVVLGAALAVLLGTSLDHSTPVTRIVMGLTVGVPLYCLVVSRPLVGLHIMVASVFFLAVVAINDENNLNGVDAMVPVLLLITWFGASPAAAPAPADAGAAAVLDRIQATARKFKDAARLYYVAAALSIVLLLVRLGPGPALSSAMHLTRSFEAVLIFPLALMWIRTERDVGRTFHVIFGTMAFLGVINLIKNIAMPHERGGLTWIINRPEWPLEGANEAGAATVMAWAMMLAVRQHRPRFWHYPVIAFLFLTLILTQSRSGLIALLIFTGLTLRRVRVRYLAAGAVLFGLMLLLAPPPFWTRMIRSITLQRGSFEMLSGYIRWYGYFTSIHAYLANWLCGVGYLGGRYVSHHYNPLGVIKLGSENFFLETAVGMGTIGFLILLRLVVRLFGLGPAMLRSAPRGSLGHEMARLHVPLMVALGFINLVGDQWIGMVGAGQVAVWCALLIRASQVGVAKASAT